MVSPSTFPRSPTERPADQAVSRPKQTETSVHAEYAIHRETTINVDNQPTHETQVADPKPTKPQVADCLGSVS